MKKSKTLVAVILAAIMIFTPTTAALAADGTAAAQTSVIYKAVYNVLGDVINAILTEAAKHMPDNPKWETQSKDGFMQGTEVFLEESAENAEFSLGYDSRSILTDDVLGKMYVAGSISLSEKFATEIADDLKVRTVAISDGSGRGISVLCEVDAYGLSLPDVRKIRTMLSSFSNEKGINSITVSVLHQHSAIDTFGMNGNAIKMLLTNPVSAYFNKDMQNGKNEKYMQNLFNVCSESIKAAVANMTSGKLYYGTASQSEYLTDKRAPFVSDENFNRFRFVPNNNSKETWLVSTEIHCVGNGAAGTVVTGDYPYYAEQVINEKANANVLFFMGAQQSTTLNRNENTVENFSEDMTRLESLAGFGKSIGNTLLKIENETEISPLLNIRYKEVLFPVDNAVLLLGCKLGLFDAYVEKADGKYYVRSEVGYMELGDNLAFAIIPGELAAEIAYGGCLQADSWSGNAWEYASLQETVSDRKLMVLDLANDQIGYIVPDNNYIPMIAKESDSIELVSLGENTASTLVTAFESLVK